MREKLWSKLLWSQTSINIAFYWQKPLMKSVPWENGRTILHLLPKMKIKGTVVKYQAKVSIASLTYVGTSMQKLSNFLLPPKCTTLILQPLFYILKTVCDIMLINTTWYLPPTGCQSAHSREESGVNLWPLRVKLMAIHSSHGPSIRHVQTWSVGELFNL